MHYKCSSKQCPNSDASIPKASADRYSNRCDLCKEQLVPIGSVLDEQMKKMINSYPALTQPLEELFNKRDVESRSIISTQYDLASVLHDWPFVVAMPLNEYFNETHPTLRLWAACDTIEMLMRFIVFSLIADHNSVDNLSDESLATIREHIERPHFKDWFVMAESLSANIDGLILPEMAKFALNSLKHLLYGDSKQKNVESSLIELRNRLAHGGGILRAEAERLLNIWKEPFERTIYSASWLKEIQIIGGDIKGKRLQCLNGLNTSREANINMELLQDNEQCNTVWLLKGQKSLILWPLTIYCRPSLTLPGEKRTGSGDALQIYSRKDDSTKLQYIPLYFNGFNVSDASDNSVDAFRELFKYDQAERERRQAAARQNFRVVGFEDDFIKDSKETVGRSDEVTKIKKIVNERTQAILWITGVAGIGKSFVMASLFEQLISEASEKDDELILPYRFKPGDGRRCSRDSFADFVQERLNNYGFLNPVSPQRGGTEPKAEIRLKDCLVQIIKGKRVVMLLDGLDEIISKDENFVKDILSNLRYPGLICVCSGRPDPILVNAMNKYGAESIFENGLPRMRKEGVRAMFTKELLISLRKKLLQNDMEKNEKIDNPFIGLVTDRADGLPLYVNYVIRDVLSNRYRVLDGNEDIPPSLDAYHEKILRRLGIGDLQSVLPPLVAALAIALEPLTEINLAILMHLNGNLHLGEAGSNLLRKGLNAIGSIKEQVSTKSGEMGYTLFHDSFRRHVLHPDSNMKLNVLKMRETFANIAISQVIDPSIASYFYCNGIRHLLDVGNVGQAKAKLLDLQYLCQMLNQGIREMDIFSYWRQIDKDDHSGEYEQALNLLGECNIDANMLAIARFVTCLCIYAGWFKRLIEIAKLVLQMHENVLGKESPDTIAAINSFALSIKARTDFEKANDILPEMTLEWTLQSIRHKSNYKYALRLVIETMKGEEIKFQKPMAQKDIKTLDTVSILASLAQTDEDYDFFEGFFKEMRCKMESTLGGHAEETLNCIMGLARILHSRGDYSTAEKLYRDVLEERERNRDWTNHPRTLEVQNNLATLLNDKGQYQDAEKIYRLLLDSYNDIMGPDHPKTIDTAYHLSKSLESQGKYAEAAYITSTILDVKERILGKKHIGTISTVRKLAQIFYANGEYDKAKPLFERCLSPGDIEASLINNPINARIIRFGIYLIKQWNHILTLIFGDKHPSTITMTMYLAQTEIIRMNYIESLRLYQKSCHELMRIHGLEHSDTLESMLGIAMSQYRLGQINDAESICRKMIILPNNMKYDQHLSKASILLNKIYSHVRPCESNIEEEYDKTSEETESKMQSKKGRCQSFNNKMNISTTESGEATNSQIKQTFYRVNTISISLTILVFTIILLIWMRHLCLLESVTNVSITIYSIPFICIIMIYVNSYLYGERLRALKDNTASIPGCMCAWAVFTVLLIQIWWKPCIDVGTCRKLFLTISTIFIADVVYTCVAVFIKSIKTRLLMGKT